jgi:OOP family OmpA-OmpF porin
MGAVLERWRPVRWGAALALLLCASMAQAQDEEEEVTTPVPLPAFSLERLALNPGLGPMTLGNGQLLPHGDIRVSVIGHYQQNPLVVTYEDAQLAFLRDRTTALLSLAYGVLPWLEVDAQIPAVALQQGEDLSTSVGITSPSRSALGAPWLSARVGLPTPRSLDTLYLAAELGVGLPVGGSGALVRDPTLSGQGRIMLGTRLGMLAPAFEVGVLLRPTVVYGTSLGTLDRTGSEVRLGAGLTVGDALRGEVTAHAAFSWEQSRTSGEVRGGLRYSPSTLVEMFALVGTGFGTEPGIPSFRVLGGLAFRYEANPAPEPENVIFELVTPVRSRRSSSSSTTERAPPVSSTVSPRWQPWTSAPEEEEPSSSGEPEAQAEPEPDTDGDGVVDAVDSCVHQQGTAAQHGCPPNTQPLVTLTREQLLLHGQVFFDTDVSTLPGPSKVLDQLARVLLEHPEIQRVVIEGHTDTAGTELHNRTLSLARAETVRRYLIEKGVPAERLRAEGFGPRRPASKNTTPRGREKNRRAELRLILVDSEASQPTQAPLQ